MSVESERARKALNTAGAAAVTLGLLVFIAGFAAGRHLREWHAEVSRNASAPGFSVIVGLLLVVLGMAILHQNVFCLKLAAVATALLTLWNLFIEVGLGRGTGMIGPLLLPLLALALMLRALARLEQAETVKNPPPRPSSLRPSVQLQLEDLEKYLEDGLITEEEHQARRKDLLRKL
jgi:hypothetical protein